MGLTELDIKTEYKSLNEDVVKQFYEPVLGETILYRRAVGFFHHLHGILDFCDDYSDYDED